jgi:hypothetical protein
MEISSMNISFFCEKPNIVAFSATLYCPESQLSVEGRIQLQSCRATRGSPVKSTTPQGPDQANVLLFFNRDVFTSPH